MPLEILTQMFSFVLLTVAQKCVYSLLSDIYANKTKLTDYTAILEGVVCFSHLQWNIGSQK